MAVRPLSQRCGCVDNDDVDLRRWDVVTFVVGVAGVATMPIAGLAAGRLGPSLLPLPNALSYLLVGGYAVLRRRDHPAARRMLWWGALLAVAHGWGAAYSALADSGARSWTGILLLHVVIWLASAASLGFLVVFPDGRYRTRGDRMVVRAAMALLPVAALGEAFGVPVLTSSDYVWDTVAAAPNPWAVPALAGAGEAATWAMRLATPIALTLGACLLLVRWIRSNAADRRRILWPLAAAAGAVALTALLRVLSLIDPAMPAALQYLLYLPLAFIVPAGLLIGMLWYDLLDLGVVVRRSLLYAALWVAIGAGYLLLAELVGVVAGQRLPLALAVATTVAAIAAAAVGRTRLTALADRLVFGRRLEDAALMVDVGRRLGAGSTPGELAAAVAEAVRQGVRAEWVRVELGEETAVAGRPPAGAAPTEAVLVAPLAAETIPLGRVACGPREIGRYADRDRALLEALARQAALAAANSALSAQLAAKVADLEASRARILRAEEAGRRRLERDLHDGVQQQLVALLTRLGLAANQLKRSTSLAATTLAEARADARSALEDLQELVRGIHPTLLTDRGLVAAVEERAARMPIPVRVVSEGPSGRLSTGAEGAAYFAISECLTNAVKHAAADHATVRITRSDDVLDVHVSDDGKGFDTAAGTGTGLAGLRDRLEALGGTLTVRSTQGQGTDITMRLPVAEQNGAAHVRPTG